MAVKVGMISLGCAKNQVDGELLMAKLKAAGYELVDDVAMADVAIVNTCGFIESAQKESIDEILELGLLKKEGRIKKLVATGCLAERFQGEMRKELPELDGVLGIGANEDPAKYLRDMLESGPIEAFPEKEKLPLSGDRELTTPSWSAYLKIAEGCDNRCSYCAIPYIRGRFRSVPMDELIEEAKRLVSNGVRELNVIAQDTTRYGTDLYGKLMLPELLTELCKIEQLKWIRVLYCYPERVTDELLDVMAREEKIVKYMDLPIQHCDGEILKRMNRTGDEKTLRELIEKIRTKVPGITLRTTLITGFPGETEEQFGKLAEFVRDMKFDRLGCFAYSAEEKTPAADMDGQLDEDVKQRRADVIMEQQMIIAVKKNKELVGSTLEIVIEGFDRYGECYFGRSAADAPEIDGKIFFTSPDKRQIPGKFVKVKITDMLDYDLIGEIADEFAK